MERQAFEKELGKYSVRRLKLGSIFRLIDFWMFLDCPLSGFLQTSLKGESLHLSYFAFIIVEIIETRNKNSYAKINFGRQG